MKLRQIFSLLVIFFTLSFSLVQAARLAKIPEGKCGVDSTASDNFDQDGNGIVDDCTTSDDAFQSSGTGYLALAKDFTVIPPATLVDDANVAGGKVLVFGGDDASRSGMAIACGTFAAADTRFFANVKVTTQRVNTLWPQVDNLTPPTWDNSSAMVPLGNQTSNSYVWDSIGEVGSNQNYKEKRASINPRVFTLSAARHCIALWGQTGVRVAAIGATAGTSANDFLAATPALSALSSGTPTATSATLTWTSDIAADTQVEYGTTTDYGTSTTLVATLGTSHSVTLNGLVPETTYHWRAKSRSGDGVLTTSDDQTLVTAAAATTGTVAVLTVGESGSTAVAPAVAVQIDALTPSTRSTATSGLASGTHTVTIEDVPGLVPTYGTCTYNEGDAACTVSTWPTAPTCNGTVCSANVTVSNGVVTKIVFRSVSPRSGHTASVIGGKNGTVITVATVADLLTLEDTYKGGNVYVTFASAGPFTLARNLVLTGAHITIDCYTAPGHEVTFINYGMTVSLIDRAAGEHATGDIIIQGCHIAKGRYVSGGGDMDTNALRITDNPTAIYSGAGVVDGVLLHHNSFTGCVDSCISLERKAQNIDLIGNIIGDTLGVPSLAVIDRNEGIGVYGNVFVAPRAITHQFVETTAGTMSSTMHVANNLFGQYQNTAGQFNTIRLRQGAKTRINDNTFLPLANNSSLGTINLDGNGTVAAHSAKLNDSIIVCNPTAQWVSGSLAEETYCPNSSLQVGGVYYNAVASTYIRDNAYQFGACTGCTAAAVTPANLSTTATAPTVATVTLTDAATSACQDFQRAGPSPRNSLETSLLNQFVLSNCAGAPQPSFDFTVATASNSLPINQGASATMQVNLGLVSGTTAPVSLDYSGLPANVTASYSTSSCSPACSSTLTITAASNATLGNATITVTGSLGEVIHTATFNLVVSAPPAATPLGFWKMDEGSETSLADSSGNGNTLTLVNGPTWVASPTAVSFDGSNDVAQRTALSSTLTTAKTITAWVYYLGANTVDGWIAGNAQEGYLYIQKSTGHLCYWDNGNSGTPACSTTAVPQNRANGTYTFVAAKTSGASPQAVSLWIDSTVTTTTMSAAPPGTGNLKFAIGGVADFASSHPLNARIRYVRVYNSAVSDAILMTLSQELLSVVETVPTPTFSPVAGNYPPATYPSGISLTISTTLAGAAIFYTTDGTTPATSVTGTTLQYSAPLSVTTATTVKAIATKANYQNSQVGSAAYTFVTPPEGNTGISDAPFAPVNTRVIIVDASNGPGTDYTTITAAAAASQPGDTIQIKNGNYAGFTIDTSGTRSEPIAYIAYAGHTPHVTSTTIAHASWIIIEGLDFSNPGAGDGLDLYYFGGNSPQLKPHSHVTIRNNIIHDNGWMGMYVQNVNELLIEKNQFLRNGIGTNHCTKWDDWGFDASHCHGIYAGKAGVQDPAYGTAEDVSDCFNIAFEHMTIRKNIFTGNSGTGIQTIANRCPIHANYNHLFENNVFVDNPVSMYFWNQTGSIVRNNTTYQQSYDTAFSGAGGAVAHTLIATFDVRFNNNTTVANNVLCTSLQALPSGSIDVFPLRAWNDQDTSKVTVSHNGFFTRSDYVPFWWWGSAHSSKVLFPSTYKSYTGDSAGIVQGITSSACTGAGFTNATGNDFHLIAGSPLINSGDNANCASEDYDGNPRTGACDIGAFNFSP